MKKQLTVLMLIFVIVISLCSCHSRNVNTPKTTNTSGSSFSESSQSTEISTEVGSESSVKISDTEESNTSIPALTASNSQSGKQTTSATVSNHGENGKVPPKTDSHTDAPSHRTTNPPVITTEPAKIPELEQSQKPDFEINYWLNYAKEYGQNIGLRLDNTATDCWDNPISAGTNCKHTKRDIQSRLDRYKNVENFTSFWVWSEQLDDENYRIYIGYA